MRKAIARADPHAMKTWLHLSCEVVGDATNVSAGSKSTTRATLVAALLLALLLCEGCGGFRARVPILHPNGLAAFRVHGEVDVSVDGATDEPFCSQNHALKDLCLIETKTALRHGLRQALLGFGLLTGTNGYRATLRLTDFSHAIGDNDASLTMSVTWQFVLVGPDGRVAVQLSDRTETPQPISNPHDLGASARRMFNAVLDRIIAGMNETEFPGASAPR